MLTLLLFAQLTAAGTPASTDRYSSPELRDFVARAAESNRVPPPELRGYAARLGTELSLVAGDSIGREQAAQIEQLAMEARWTRTGRYDIHVLGYRSQSIGVPFSALSFTRSWTVPVLYGDRLELGFEPTGGNRRGSSRDSIHAVHPLASDRDRYYRFSGGDTITLLRTVVGEVPVVRVHVEPTIDGAARVAVFQGDLDFDATRSAIVRMRGRFIVVSGARGGLGPWISRFAGVTAVAYAELVNGLFDGRYWLPSYQRTEFQASFAMLGDTRSVYRLVTEFRDHRIDADSTSRAHRSDTTVQLVRTLTYAPSDSMSGFSDWPSEFGVATAAASVRDFEDLAPDGWRVTGAPTLGFHPRTTDEFVRYNRVEGWYTGASATLRMRDRAPGLSVRGFGGWAWSEVTPRGGAVITLERNGRWLSLRAERALASTNDLTRPAERASMLAALLASIDDRDYVDRRLASLSLTQPLGSLDVGMLTVETRLASDRAERRRLTRGPLGGSRHFRENRASADGWYGMGSATLELAPDVSGEFLHPGFGARLHHEAAGGALHWQRSELSLSARRYWRALLLAARADGGMVFGGALPPQTLFEIGGNEGLPGYGYKEFGGDRAAVARAMVGYAFPFLTKPMRLWRHYVVPGLAPGFAAGISGGWAEATSPAVRQALLTFGEADPAAAPPAPTDGIRATVDVRLTLLSGSVGIGVARPIDHGAPWRFAFTLGPTF